MASAALRSEAWRERLNIPAYQIKEAAKYADVSAGTVTDWHKSGGRKTLSDRASRAGLSYLQLIEVAVVAAAREAGVKLRKIRAARDYVAKQLRSDHPFAEYRFKTNGRDLLLDYENFDPNAEGGRLVSASQAGQMAWASIVGRLKQFEYEDGGIVLRWRVGGAGSPVVIDPRVSFGAPSIRGIPTWVIRDRWLGGDTVPEIADDYGLTEEMVKHGLRFEDVDLSRPPVWVH